MIMLNIKWKRCVQCTSQKPFAIPMGTANFLQIDKKVNHINSMGSFTLAYLWSLLFFLALLKFIGAEIKWIKLHGKTKIWNWKYFKQLNCWTKINMKWNVSNFGEWTHTCIISNRIIQKLIIAAMFPAVFFLSPSNIFAQLRKQTETKPLNRTEPKCIWPVFFCNFLSIFQLNNIFILKNVSCNVICKKSCTLALLQFWSWMLKEVCYQAYIIHLQTNFIWSKATKDVQFNYYHGHFRYAVERQKHSTTRVVRILCDEMFQSLLNYVKHFHLGNLNILRLIIIGCLLWIISVVITRTL